MKLVPPPKLVIDQANQIPDAGEVECIAKQLATNGYRIFSGEIRALWKDYDRLKQQCAADEGGKK